MPFISPLSMRTFLIAAAQQLIIRLNRQQRACDTNPKMSEVEIEAKHRHALSRYF